MKGSLFCDGKLGTSLALPFFFLNEPAFRHYEDLLNKVGVNYKTVTLKDYS